MAKPVADGVVEAIRFGDDHNISLARVYVRHGGVFTDCKLYTREQLIEAIQSGKKFFSGSRKPYFASSFFLNQPLTLHEQNGNPFIGVNTSNSPHDDPEVAPLF
jgi:hypothetical protein